MTEEEKKTYMYLLNTLATEVHTNEPIKDMSEEVHKFNSQVLKLLQLVKRQAKEIEELKSYIYKGKNAPQDFLQYRIKDKIQGYEELLKEE